MSKAIIALDTAYGQVRNVLNRKDLSDGSRLQLNDALICIRAAVQLQVFLETAPVPTQNVTPPHP